MAKIMSDIERLPEPQRKFNKRRYYEHIYDVAKKRWKRPFTTRNCRNDLCIENFSLSKFCNDYAKTIEKIVDKSEMLIDYLLSHPVKLGDLSEEDETQLEIYITSQYLLYAELSTTTKEKQKYIYIYQVIFLKIHPERQILQQS